MYKIGFSTTDNTENIGMKEPQKSIVQVYFEHRNMTLSYFNDSFNLKVGDIVYVEGKLEGFKGRIVDISYNFKIKVSDYKRVIAVADTDVSGNFFFAGSHFIAFERDALPKEKVRTWFLPPKKEDDEYVSGNDDKSFLLNNLNEMNVSHESFSKGHQYYVSNQVSYICIDNKKGYAIVEGTQPYEVEFIYDHGEISNLTCSCYCAHNCKHQVAAMMQLNDIIGMIDSCYENEYNNYFVAVVKSRFFEFVVDTKQVGSINIG